MGWNIAMPDAEWITRDTGNVESIIRAVEANDFVAIDTETTGLKYMNDIVLYWSLSWEEKNQPGNIRRACLRADVLPYFQHIFRNSDRNWYLANAKFDRHMLYNTNVNLAGKTIDIQVAHALLYEEMPHRLEFIGNQLFGWQWKDDFKTGFKKEGPGPFLQRLEREELSRLVEYASNDAYTTLCGGKELRRQLEAEQTYTLYPEKYGTMWDYFYKIEVPFTRVLWKCERRGFFIDSPYLKSLEEPAVQKLREIERKITSIVGRPINLRSRDQIAQYFFEDCGYKPLKMTKGGKTGVKKASTDFDSIEYFAQEHGDEVANLMLTYREYDKLYGTYIMGIQGALDMYGRVHTKFNQDVARTGRLSSSDINLQNIPRPDSDVFKIRKAFIHEPGNGLVVADYEQLEMRLLASAALEPDMIQLFLDNKDIHMGNASLVFDLPYEDLVKAKKTDKLIKDHKIDPCEMTEYLQHCLDSRQAAKAIGFGQPVSQAEVKLPQNGELYTAEAA